MKNHHKTILIPALSLLLIMALGIGAVVIAAADNPSKAPTAAEAATPWQWAEVAGSPRFINPNGAIEVTPLIEPKPESNSSIYMGYAIFHAGAEVAVHQHDDADEYLYFLSGEGEAIVGGKTVPVKPNSAIYLPKGVAHSFKNTGAADVIAVQVYSPSGPEKRFKQWKLGTK